MLQDVEEIPALDVEHDVFEPDAAALSFALSLSKYLMDTSVTPSLCSQSAAWHCLQCAHQCAQTRSDDHHSAANANQVPNEKRA